VGRRFAAFAGTSRGAVAGYGLLLSPVMWVSLRWVSGDETVSGRDTGPAQPGRRRCPGVVGGQRGLSRRRGAWGAAWWGPTASHTPRLTTM